MATDEQNAEPQEPEYCENEPPLLFDERHTDACHKRWIKHQNRIWPNLSVSDEDIPDRWTNEQCGQCRFYIPLTGLLTTDWGVCSHAKSLFDGKVMFEHDGCDDYLGADRWAGE